MVPDPAKVFRILKKTFPDVKPPLDHDSPEQLAVAVILSAQCTDERVNLVTPELFRNYPDMQALASAPVAELERLVFSTGFYRNKARNISALARILVNEYGGRIPDDFEILTGLPGIGRKTANVILNQAFDRAEGIVVDTHVMRLSRRMGYSGKTDAVQVERDLMGLWPRRLWRDMPLLLIFLGRRWCTARKPDCAGCPLIKICPRIGV